MDRYTKLENSGNAVIRGDSIYSDCGTPEGFKGDAIDRLAAYEDLEEQGRLVVLPCKVGTPIYWINFNQHDGYWIELGEFHLQDIGVFGKTVFLTREEAEEKLKERDGK